MSAAARERLGSPTSNLTVSELVSRCTRRPADKLAWQEFVRRFHATIRASVARVFDLQARSRSGARLSPHEQLIGELVDAVYRRLVENHCEALKLFDRSKADSMDKYLLMIAIRVVRDHLRQCRSGA